MRILNREVGLMKAIDLRRVWAFALIALVGLLVGGAPSAWAAPPRPPVVELGTAAALAPDGRSLSVEVIARCPQKGTLLEAVVTVTQPQASGLASIPLTCDDLLRPLRITVDSTGAPFRLGEAQVRASVIVKRGKTQQAQDSELVQVQPLVFVELATTALLQGGGEALLIDVTVACPVGAIGLDSSDVSIGQDQAGGFAGGVANYVPICDGQLHTLTVRVPAAQGLFRAGSALATTFAAVEAAGNPFLGVDQKTIQIVT